MGVMKRSIKKATGYSKAKARVKKATGYTAARRTYKSWTSPAYHARKVTGVNTARRAYYRATTPGSLPPASPYGYKAYKMGGKMTAAEADAIIADSGIKPALKVMGAIAYIILLFALPYITIPATAFFAYVKIADRRKAATAKEGANK